MDKKALNLERAVLETIAYTDVFDFPLTLEEIHRYLIHMRASLPTVRSVLEYGHLERKRIEKTQGYFTLPGRRALAEKRRRREEVSAFLWDKAVYYGYRIANLPFVRMVAVTGALAVNNVSREDDLDYLIVTEPGRLWSCRALIILLVVRAAALRGLVICPNYLLAENALEFKERNLYTAHELTQMVPLVGKDIYKKLRRENRWTNVFLPNATGSPPSKFPIRPQSKLNKLKEVCEKALRTPPGEWFERWEMNRKVRRFKHLVDSSEADFGPNYCKGHFDSHGQRTLSSYNTRLREMARRE